MAYDLQPLIDEMTAATTAFAAGVVFCDSVPGLIQAGIDAALDGGATAEQLEPLAALKDQVAAQRAAFLAAMAANTPNPPPIPVQGSGKRLKFAYTK